MLLDIIITVLRETLEAGVLISILISVGKLKQISASWVGFGLLGGVLGAVVYALNLGRISQAFEYAGQEVINATLQYLIYVILLVFLTQISRPAKRSWLLVLLMISVVGLVLVREGAEIMILFSALLMHEGMVIKVFTSGFVGLAIGVSVGIICYYLLGLLSPRLRVLVLTLLLIMIGSGMVAQATQLLIQVDWIEASHPLWDSGYLLSESSVVGQVAYAIFGYEATPTFIEVLLYTLSMAISLITFIVSGKVFVKEPSS